ncbi:MAG: ketoacyl-ACP synthase III [Saprospiraceae bacterium]|nr:ketoacyl-ACP synthase III [Saprospiraceae bacterium]
MASQPNSVLIGTGSYIPNVVVENTDFLKNTFYDQSKVAIATSNQELIKTFQKITNIDERRYVEDQYVTSDIAFLAAQNCIQSSGVDAESLDSIIVAHNFGDVKKNNRKSDMVPSLASRVKFKLGIKNPYTTAFDLIFGCPGWLQGVIQADYQIRSGNAKRILIIGAETLSRVSDPHDRDSMIYSDGAGATIFEARDSDSPIGIISHVVRTDAINEAHLLEMKESNNPDYEGHEIYLKMQGRKLYEYALNQVPLVVKSSLEKANLDIRDISKILIHQANEKMDEAIIQRLFKLYNIAEVPVGIMPMIISKLGNSSVATIPTLLDLILKNEIPNQYLKEGQYCVFASVGAGMNINSMVYRF